MRAPYITRLRTSLPYLSAPSMWVWTFGCVSYHSWFHTGGARESRRCCFTGSKGAINGAETAMKMSSKSAMPGITGQRRINHQTLDGQFQMSRRAPDSWIWMSAGVLTYPYLILGSTNV